MEFIWHCSKQPKIEKQPKNLLRGDRYIFASRTMGLFMPSKKNEGSLVQGYGKICKICYIVSHYLFWWKDDKEENWVFGKPGSRGFLAFFFYCVIVATTERHRSHLLKQEAQSTEGPRCLPLDIQLHSYRRRAFPSCSEPMTQRHSGSSASSTNKLLFRTLTLLATGLPISLAKFFLKLLCNQNLPSKPSFSFFSYQPCEVETGGSPYILLLSSPSFIPVWPH